jgi:hypothetical protein
VVYATSQAYHFFLSQKIYKDDVNLCLKKNLRFWSLTRDKKILKSNEKKTQAQPGKPTESMT